MSILIITSSLDTNEKDQNGVRIPHNFGNQNGILDTLKSSIKKYDNFLFVASSETGYEHTDMYFNVTKTSFNLTLPFKNYHVLDGRTKDNARQLINDADFIFLCGGHVPTQNTFFNKINLKELLKKYNGVICGGSAGSMNCAGTVYCPPELDGESVDPKFKRFIKGLGLTNINVYPHFQDERNIILDGKRNLEDIIIPDSYKTKII